MILYTLYITNVITIKIMYSILKNTHTRTHTRTHTHTHTHTHTLYILYIYIYIFFFITKHIIIIFTKQQFIGITS